MSTPPFDAQELAQRAQRTHAQVQQAFRRIQKKKPAELDTIVLSLHEQAFEQIDCLACANCCRTLGPRLSDKDIDKLARHLRLRPSEMVERHLRIDEDGDYVFRQMPCPFLAADNYCTVYADRPKACREYPHTDRRRFVQLLPLTLRNRATCPAVYQIAEQLVLHYP